MKIYTRTGDHGDTGLFDGSRVRKDDLRVAAYGTVDELNAHIGVAVAMAAGRRGAGWETLRERLAAIQHELFSIGAELATPGERNRDKVRGVRPMQTLRLENWIDDAMADAPELRVFVLPGGDPLAAQLHVCRTVCRRAEREIVAADAARATGPEILIYVNRLSDLLFAWARWANHLAGEKDVPWEKPG